MRTLLEFLHFHRGSPQDRAVKVLGCLIGATLLATTAVAATGTEAAHGPARAGALHIVEDCAEAAPEFPTITDDRAVLTWTTTVPAADTRVILEAPAATRAIPARSDGTVHTAVLDALESGVTYRYRLHVEDPATGVSATSGTCAFTVPGTDRTPPVVHDATVTSVDSIRARLRFTVNEPGTATVRLRPIPPLRARVGANPSVVEVTVNVPAAGVTERTIESLDPGTTYDVTLAVHDRNGNRTPLALPPLRTSPRVADRTPPEIHDITCTITERGARVRFTVPEVPAYGRIEYGEAALDRVLEASPTTIGASTVLTRTIPDATRKTAIRAIGIDGDSNASQSAPIPCS